MSKEIEKLIAELEEAHKWSSSLFVDDSLGWLIAELRSGNPERVAGAIAKAQKIIAEYRAERRNDNDM